MFRNLRLYRVSGDWPASEDELSNQLQNLPFKPCGSYSERSAGWEAPVAEQPDLLARRVAGADFFRLRTQSRLLPSAAVNEALEDRVAEFEARMERLPGRKEKRDLKDEVVSELMPRALLKSDRTWGLFLLAEKVLAVDTASETQAERFLDALRSAFGSLPLTPLEFREPVSKLLTAVFLGGGPTAFVTGRECRMLDPSTGSASVSWMDIDLSDPSVQRHVRDGLKLDRLALGFDELATLVLDQDCVIRKLKLGGTDHAEDGDSLEEDPVGRLDADLVLVSGVLARLLRTLRKSLGEYS
ncbi:MAG TPA: recombination-associated protein RdgC [Pseudomonadales bacterium]